MPVTEQKASDMWCPHARASIDSNDNNAANRGTGLEHQNTSYARCIGSKCMAWRWAYERDDASSTRMIPVMQTTNETWVCKECNGTGNVSVDGYLQGCPECDGKGSGKVYAQAGYCGIAGKE